jgi:hypothetical protein
LVRISFSAPCSQAPSAYVPPLVSETRFQTDSQSRACEYGSETQSFVRAGNFFTEGLLVREGAPHQQNHKCFIEIKIRSWTPDECLTPRETGRLTVGRNMTLTLTDRLTNVKLGCLHTAACIRSGSRVFV